MLRKFALVIVAVSSLGRGHVDADAGIRVAGARLGTWMGMASRLGMGRDHVSSWRRDFTEADVSSGVLSLARGDRVGFS
jgi:hypothetical protein